MRKLLALALMSMGLWLAPLSAMAADTKIEGTVAGYTCVLMNIACPADAEDPVIAAEKIFVVVTDDGYYFLPNIDRAILARHINEKARVTGQVDPKYKSIAVNTLEFKKGGDWKVSWSQQMEREWQKRLDPYRRAD